MHSTAPAALLAMLLASAGTAPAEAADITTAQASTLQSQMQGWLQGMLGPDVRITERAVQVRPEGDHYRIEVPLGLQRAGHVGPVTLSASAQPAEGGRWTFEGPDIPLPVSFTFDMPVPPKGGQQVPASTIPVEYTITAGSQTSEGSYDPSFATPSRLTSSSRDLQVRARSALADQLTKIDRSASAGTLRPAGSGRVDFKGDATIEGYSSVSKFPDEPPFELSAQREQGTTEITALSRDRAAIMLPAIARIGVGFLTGVPGSDSNAPATRPWADPVLLRTIVQSLQDLASEFTMNDTFDGVAWRAGSRNGAANQARISLRAKADNGLLQASMDLSLDGLIFPPDPALGAMAELLPRKVALRPVLTGVPTAELIQWLAAKADARDGVRSPGLAALFRHGDVSAGLESFAIDVGGASFAGMGALTSASPESLAGQAQVTAANFDDLLARVNNVPELSGVLPLLVFAKGVSRTVEGRLVWDIAYRDNKVSINGTDLSAMTGSR